MRPFTVVQDKYWRLKTGVVPTKIVGSCREKLRDGVVELLLALRIVVQTASFKEAFTYASPYPRIAYRCLLRQAFCRAWSLNDLPNRPIIRDIGVG